MPGVALICFDTAIGPCGIAWDGPLVRGVWLPEPSRDATLARMLRRWPGASQAEPPSAVAEAVDAITALLRGEPRDLRFIAIDLRGVPEFDRRVYAIGRDILPGHTRTYGEIAADLGDPAAARRVGAAMGANRYPIVMPCHRVLAADGRPGGFSAPGGVATKLRLLRIERAPGFETGELFDDA